MLFDVNTLAKVQQDRYNEFVRDAETRRLLRQQQSAGQVAKPVVAGQRNRTNVVASFIQMFLDGVQSQSRGTLSN
jgi:hypothetical protein